MLNSDGTRTGKAFSIIDDGRVVSVRVCTELALSTPCRATETALLPYALKSSSLAKTREAFGPWITYVNESRHVKMVNYGKNDEEACLLIIVIGSVLIFLWGALYSVGVVILSSFIGLCACKAVQARTAFPQVAKEVSELANRLQKALEPESAEIRPLCVQGHCLDSCHFFLDITVPIFNRSMYKSCQRTAAKAQQDDVEPCAICLEEFQESQLIRVLPCSHRYHAACADGWLRNSALCPLCKCATGGDTSCTFVV
eukprot:gnl/TRDRNA2_/TRDRNA2_173000_c0_seq8.p1 gnl/TRDRNA2_/TRDRNA2_173000_c0~~gnl/TRDRNA2_/TRDRNA2_173000_c0_seq8.p1  ORF type:complete len:285 (+),score=26.84 gnl/TRDRNA2_/TRDRNA2_173000_c0_seq8:89-856(+)